MALADLLAALERDAVAERDAILETARDEAARLARTDEERLARRRREVLEPKERALRAAATAAVVAARRRARAEVLEARDRLLSRVRAAAKQRLPRAVGDARYLALAPKHLAEALAFLGAGPAVVRCAPAIADVLRRETAARADITIVPDEDSPARLAVEAEGGTLVVENGLDARLARLDPQLAVEISAKCGVDLFGDRW